MMYEYKAKLVRVIDGDTVVMDIDLGFHTRVKKYCRLLGIDTPELRSGDPDERVLAYDAKSALEQKLASAPSLVVRTKLDKTGKYGRVLARIFRSNGEGEFEDVNEWLVKAGHAKRINE